eukprot:1369530-Pleurochrysis_carterae.AAC.6
MMQCRVAPAGSAVAGAHCCKQQQATHRALRPEMKTGARQAISDDACSTLPDAGTAVTPPPPAPPPRRRAPPCGWKLCELVVQLPCGDSEGDATL